MKKNQKINAVIFLFFISIILIDIFWNRSNVNEKLNKCTVYTIAKISKVYKQSGGVNIKFNYKINSAKISDETGVSPYDTDEWWSIDMEKLRNKKLLVAVSCEDNKISKINWNVQIPDTLQYIPVNGWDKIPYGLDNSK